MTDVLQKLRRANFALLLRRAIPRYAPMALLGRNGVCSALMGCNKPSFLPSSGLRPRIEGYTRLSTLALLMSLFACMPLASAHEGNDDDHDEHAPVTEVAAQTPRLTYQSPRIESVALIDTQGLLIWVDDFASNQPLSDLAVSARVGSAVVQAQEIEAGTYRVPLDLLGDPHQPEFELNLSLRGKAWEEHYAGHLPRAQAADHAAPPAYSVATLALAVLIFVGLLVLSFVAWRRRPRA
jgi:hypothetical protein